MKALDTSVLLAILEGNPAARNLVRRLKGIELATSEINLTELAVVAIIQGERRRAARLASLDRLRRTLTVLPIEAAGTREAIAHAGGGGASGPASAAMLASLGAFEAAACDEMFTSDPAAIRGKWHFKVTKFQSTAIK